MTLDKPLITKATVATLRQLRSRLAQPLYWTKGAAARDAAGRPVDPYHSSACKWCLLGAMMRDFGPGTASAREVLIAIAGHRLAAFNDTHTHDEVIAKIESAIALAKAAVANQGASNAERKS